MLNLDEAIDPISIKSSEKNNTSSTSNTGGRLKSDNPTSIQHQSKLKQAPAIEQDALIDVVENKQGSRMGLIVESKAAQIIRNSLLGFLSYDGKSQTWFEFKGTHWEPLESPQLAERLIVDLLYIGTGDLGFKTAYKNGIKSILTDGDMLPLPEVDCTKLPFKNGLLDLKTRKLGPLRWNNAQTWCLPYEYQSNIDCPMTKSWLSQAVGGDQETVEYLRAWMAAVLLGRNDLQKFLHLLGPGGTGKGTFIRLNIALVGKRNAAYTSLEQLEKNRFETANLYNKRLAVISESDKYGGSINNLKAVTGQDHIRLERKHQQQAGGFIFQGLVMIASNESLQVTDHTSGLDRRRITVIFDRRATDDERQAWEALGGEEAVLHAEMPGIVNWALEIPAEDISRIINNPPERIRNANLDAMRATNPIVDWIIECTEADTNAWTQIGDKREIRVPGYETTYQNSGTRLYPNYLQWCIRNHKTPFAIRRFRELFIQTCRTLNIEVHQSKRSEGMGIVGIRIKQID